MSVSDTDVTSRFGTTRWRVSVVGLILYSLLTPLYVSRPDDCDGRVNMLPIMTQMIYGIKANKTKSAVKRPRGAIGPASIHLRPGGLPLEPD